ncbi:hypothetical protein CMQ_386 [Grosmannia clavigera kw1407]|uniref:Uncharacterized protein n=1 Tax=Grosmannia clavigera (strain kw1407 / UAMH 11150) TaxID=655863 RepID=F0XEU0_GROCL|nr:uncharacterized protein CMQ_386 [Grosmannia clavigera kw1407]EFX03458.1 hypothetical protein CMQ_386 [Grosmannia clavigera kw1407]
MLALDDGAYYVAADDPLPAPTSLSLSTLSPGLVASSLGKMEQTLTPSGCSTQEEHPGLGRADEQQHQV